MQMENILHNKKIVFNLLFWMQPELSAEQDISIKNWVKC